MKRKLLIALGIIILLLDFAALDDITTGKEPSFIGEYLMLLISLPMLFTIGYFLFTKSKN